MRKLFIYSSVLISCLCGQAVSPTINPLPTRQFGHPALVTPVTQASPNLVEGKELDAPGQIALDTSVSPPILYIADIANNRVLGYKNAPTITPGKTADLVIGQQDFQSTLAQGGPSSVLTTGLNSPVGLAVDSKGNLYVADAGNNRIMRFPTPFNNPGGSTPTPDLVIGQKSFSSGTSYNEGNNGICSNKSLGFSGGNGVYVTGLAIDSNGNLWTTDPGNNRVLMFPAANLAPYTVEPTAGVVLGQNSFNSCTFVGNTTGNAQLTKNSLVQPSSLAFDTSGNLYIADSYARVLYYPGSNFTVGQPAARVLGIAPPRQQGQQPVVYPNEYTLGNFNSGGSLTGSPNGVFTNGNHLYVADTPQSRIVEYDIPSNWSVESTTTPSPQIMTVIGQNGFTTGTANQGNPQPNSSTLAGPYSVAFDKNNTMWVADTGNNRVLGFLVNVTGSYAAATTLVGQLDYIYNAPNLIEGREVFLAGVGGSASGMVVDRNSNPPHLYVADPGNNRILCFNDARSVGKLNPQTAIADRVIGQPDFKTSEINYPMGFSSGQATATGLFSPIGVAVDNNGNLYVADAGNGRVVRFPSPFSQPAGQIQTANLVLGQPTLTTVIQNATQSSMRSPYGVALFAGSDANATPYAGGIAVSDPVFNRVLFFKKGAGGDFTSGQNASIVIGQSSFAATSAGNGLASFNHPRGIASDTSDRLYVADTDNGRVQAFTQVPETFTNGLGASQTYPNLSSPYGVAVSPSTFELWVANTGGQVVTRYPEYIHCQTVSCATTSTLAPGAAPIGVALDASDNVIVGDVANRITFFFPRAIYRNAASFNTQPLAPGMLAILARIGLQMTLQDGKAQTDPWPFALGGINLTVNGTKAALFNTSSSGIISFQVPYEAPSSGTADFIVTDVNTGAILAVGTFPMAKANPGFFTATANGEGPVAATNKDSKPNTASNPALRGDFVTFYLTGLGLVPNAPADGAAPTAANYVDTNSASLLVAVQGSPYTVLYSGVGAFAGGWQINVQIPSIGPVPGANSVVLSYLGFPSKIAGNPQNNADGTPGPDIFLSGSIQTTVWIK